MAYKCVETTYSKRLYEEGQTYDDIGDAGREFFVKVGGESSEDTGSKGAGASSSDERAEIKAILDEMNIEYNKSASTASLKKRLLKAQQEALLT
jgi:hypothetical protein